MKALIRIEEAFLVLLTFWLSIRLGFSWWIFIVLLFVPDISILGYLFGNKKGAIIYNLVHLKAVAITIAFIGFFIGYNVLILSGLVLFGHSSLDRVFGFGLKFPDDFNHTHLGYIGKNDKQRKK